MKLNQTRLVATFYHQPEGSDYDTDDALEYHLYETSPDFAKETGKRYMLADIDGNPLKTYEIEPTVSMVREDISEDAEA